MPARILPPALLWGLLVIPAAGQVTFTDVTARRGLGLDMTPPVAGTSVGDVDGDGWHDIVVFGATDRRPQLLLNRGAAVLAGTEARWFVNASSWAIPEEASPASTGMLVDLDNDGDLDLVTVRRYFDALKGQEDPFDTGLEFYRNVDGHFEMAVADPFLGRSPDRTGGLTVADTDVDGDLDVVFVHNSMGPGTYAVSDGFPRYVDLTSQFGAGLGNENRYFTAVLADFNGDMLPDLHVAVDAGWDFHCRNLGGGVFQDVTQQAGTTNVGSDMGLAIGDIENDGDLDIYSTNINYGVLYVNDGSGTFSDEAGQRGVQGWGQKSSIGWGTNFVDLDLDRDQDLLFVAGGAVPGRVYENDGAGFFTEITAATGAVLDGFGLISFDYDRDGDLDLLVTRLASLRLLENHAADDGSRHWVRVELEGTTSNRQGVGARVQITTPDGTTQTRHIIAGFGYQNGPPLEAHFGLGGSGRITQLVITWPTGQVDVYGPLVGDRLLRFTE